MSGANPTSKDEPPPNAKVILFTSHGQLELELWGRETPLASRNFLQHCMNGYYNETIFHRMIPGFMIQGGDPTGTGTGGQSIYGQHFKDEFHQRLKFARRGMVAMANRGPNTNGSQFFMTFGECEHLNKKHTIFGRVIGDTIYNLMALQSIDTESQDRPSDPPRIRRVKIVLNPFDDMVATIKHKEEIKKVEVKKADPVLMKAEIKKIKKKNKLTFDMEEEEVVQTVKSVHDSGKDSKLSAEVAVDTSKLAQKVREKEQEQKRKRELKDRVVAEADAHEEDDDDPQGLKGQQLAKKKKLNELLDGTVKDEVLNYQTAYNPTTNRNELVWQGSEKDVKKERQEEKLRAIKELRQQETDGLLADELNFKKIKEGSHKTKRKELLNQQIELLSSAERIRYEFLKKTQQQKVDKNISDKLGSFMGRLRAKTGQKWMNHSLKFHIDSEAAYNFDQKKKMTHNDQGELEDGGLKVEVDHTEPLMAEFNVDQLYDMIHGDDEKAEREEEE